MLHHLKFDWEKGSVERFVTIFLAFFHLIPTSHDLGAEGHSP
jgi:hypothetical protein